MCQQFDCKLKKIQMIPGGSGPSRTSYSVKSLHQQQEQSCSLRDSQRRNADGTVDQGAPRTAMVATAAPAHVEAVKIAPTAGGVVVGQARSPPSTRRRCRGERRSPAAPRLPRKNHSNHMPPAENIFSKPPGLDRDL